MRALIRRIFRRKPEPTYGMEFRVLTPDGQIIAGPIDAFLLHAHVKWGGRVPQSDGGWVSVHDLLGTQIRPWSLIVQVKAERI